MSDFFEWHKKNAPPGSHIRSLNEPIPTLQLPTDEVYRRLEAKVLSMGSPADEVQGLLLRMANTEIILNSLGKTLAPGGDVWAAVETALDGMIATQHVRKDLPSPPTSDDDLTDIPF